MCQEFAVTSKPNRAPKSEDSGHPANSYGGRILNIPEDIEISFPSEYRQATYYCELLLCFESTVSSLAKEKGDTYYEAVWRDPEGDFAHKMLRTFTCWRAILAEDEADLQEADSRFIALLTSVNGQSNGHMLCRVRGDIEECISEVKTWIASLKPFIEAATDQSAFEWIELADRVRNPSIDVSGVDGRLAILRRLCNMLDSVTAMSDSPDEASVAQGPTLYDRGIRYFKDRKWIVWLLFAFIVIVAIGNVIDSCEKIVNVLPKQEDSQLSTRPEETNGDE
jgi:hypothetical protein